MKKVNRREATNRAFSAARKAARRDVYAYCDINAAVRRAFDVAANACGCECAAERIREAEKAELERLREDWRIAIRHDAETAAWNHLWRWFSYDIAASLARRYADLAADDARRTAWDEAID